MTLCSMMRDVVDEYKERVMIGEIYLPIHKLVTYYGADNKGAHLPFNFLLLTCPGMPANCRCHRLVRRRLATRRLA